MFDLVGIFARMFTPFQDGYLYYGSHWSGGKFVTQAEYDTLLARWRRVAGPVGMLKFAGCMFATIVASVFISVGFGLPEWLNQALTLMVMLSLIAWILWHALAPLWLVRGREAVAPPRSMSESMRVTRAMIPWPMVIGIGLISGLVFIAILTHPAHETSWWAGLIGSGAMSGICGWVGWKKLHDR